MEKKIQSKTTIAFLIICCFVQAVLLMANPPVSQEQRSAISVVDQSESDKLHQGATRLPDSDDQEKKQQQNLNSSGWTKKYKEWLLKNWQTIFGILALVVGTIAGHKVLYSNTYDATTALKKMQDLNARVKDKIKNNDASDDLVFSDDLGLEFAASQYVSAVVAYQKKQGELSNFMQANFMQANTLLLDKDSAKQAKRRYETALKQYAADYGVKQNALDSLLADASSFYQET